MEDFPLISELNDLQKGHMAYLLDAYTYCGYFTAGRILRGEIEDYKNMPINKIFESFNLTSVKVAELSEKVLKYPQLLHSESQKYDKAAKLLEQLKKMIPGKSKRLGQ